MRFKPCYITVLSLFLLSSALIVPGVSFDDSFSIINEYSDAILHSSYSIDDVNVAYYIHQINGVIIKNDYVLVQTNLTSDELIKKESKWSEIPEILDLNNLITPDIDRKYFFIHPVLFIEPHDLKQQYQIESLVSFPLLVWETRHIDGSTVLYDQEGNQVGTGLPTPWDGYSLSGFHESSWPDPWIDFRLNADLWYQKWSDQTVSMSTPTPVTISSHVSDQENNLFYELAHGAETYFQADSTGSYYRSSMTETDMQYREKYRFAFIGSCHGMTSTDEGTFSHAFRKGSMTDTVTIGYDHMEECPGWSDALEWQDYMFYAMDNGYTIKDAFDTATAEYPAIAPAVVFVGDESITIFDDNGGGDEPNIIPPHVYISYPFEGMRTDQDTLVVTGTADDLDGKVDHVYVKLDGGSWQEAEGTSNWQITFDLHTNCEPGAHLITAVAVDDDNIQSGCVYKEFYYDMEPLEVEIEGPDKSYVNDTVNFDLKISGNPVEPNEIKWDFDDGSISSIGSHTFEELGTYHVSVSVIDANGRTGSDSHYIQILRKESNPPEIEIIKPSDHFIIKDIPVFPWIKPVIIGLFSIELQIIDESELHNTQVTFNGETYSSDQNDEHPEWIIDNPCVGQKEIIIESQDIHGNTNEITVNIWKLF